MALFVHHGPRLAALGDGLAERLAAPTVDVFEPIVVAVPTAGVRDWLSRRLATRLGVAANIAMPFPGRFLAAALGIGPDDDDPWDVERVTWAVLDVLESEAVDVPGWAKASQRFAFARRIADLFDRYATDRPTILRQWQRGIPGDGTERQLGVGGTSGADDDRIVGALPQAMAWQFHLWHHVRRRIGVPSPAEQLPELVEGLRRGDLPPALPTHVEVFGSSTVTPSQLAVLHALGAVRDVHVSLLHPSSVAWHRTPPIRGFPAIRGFRDGRVGSKPSDDTKPSDGDGLDGHPLLRSWGRLSAETAAVVRGLPVDVVADSPPASIDGRPTTLLEHVRRDLIADREPTPFSRRPADTTIQVHACHGTVRQLEVLRDVLAHLFVADPTLRPDDVLVLCPDLHRFEPFAEAVFGRSSLPVPLAVSDLSLGSENPIAAALVGILRTLEGRCSAGDVLGIAALEPVRMRLGITADDLARFATWTDQLGTSWGLDGEHRRRWLDADIDAGTWETSIRSLLVGAAMPAPDRRVAFDGIVPYDDVSGDDIAAAGRLAELVGRLRRIRALVAAPMTVNQWCDVLVDVVAALCAAAPADAWQVATVTDALDDVRHASSVDDRASTTLLGLDDVVAIVEGTVAGRRGRLQLRTGRVAMTGTAPVRNVPAKVVCLLGFDDASLRPPGIDGDDLLAVKPCVGERDRRAERRRVLLDAVMAAEQTLVITCDGNDVTTNRRTRFAVQLNELLDVIDATLGPSDTSRDVGDERDSPVLTRHPLRAFDERNFDVGGIDAVSGVFSFDDVMRRAAEVDRVADNRPESGPHRWQLTPAPPAVSSIDSVTLAQLTEACVRPAKVLLRDSVVVRLPNEIERRDPNIPLSVAPLPASGLGRRLLDQYRQRAAELRATGAGGDWNAVAFAAAARWVESERLAGTAPPGLLIEHALASVSAEVDRLVDGAAAAACVGAIDVLGAGDTVEVDTQLVVTGAALPAPIPDPVELRLVDSVGGITGRTICRLGYRRPRPGTVLAAALDLAAVVTATEDADWRAITVARPPSRSVVPEAHVLEISAADPVKAARSLLEVAAELRFAALRSAVPAFEQATYALAIDGVLDEEILAGTDYRSGDLTEPENHFVWGDVTGADLLAWKPSPRRLAEMIWGSIAALVTITSTNQRRSND